MCGDGEVYDDADDPLRFEACDDGNTVLGTLHDVPDRRPADLRRRCRDGGEPATMARDDGGGCSATCTEEARLTMTWRFENVATSG